MAEPLVKLTLLLLSCWLAPAASENKLKLHSLEKIKEFEGAFQSSVKLGDPDAEGNILISGDLKQLVTLDDEYEVKIAIHSKKSGEESGTDRAVPAMGVCKMMSSYYKSYAYDHLRNFTNAPAPDDCPLAPREYHVKDYPLHTSSMKELLKPGFYSVVGQLEKGGETQLEYRIEFDVE